MCTNFSFNNIRPNYVMASLINKFELKCNHCSKLMTISEFNEHKLECEEYPIKCTKCNEDLKRKDQKTHLMSDCIKNVIPCPKNCGFGYVVKDEEAHVGVCSKEFIKCYFGCPQKILREEEKKHEEEKCQHHLRIVSTKLIRLQLQFCKLKARKNKSFIKRKFTIQSQLKKKN